MKKEILIITILALLSLSIYSASLPFTTHPIEEDASLKNLQKYDTSYNCLAYKDYRMTNYTLGKKIGHYIKNNTDEYEILPNTYTVTECVQTQKYTVFNNIPVTDEESHSSCKDYGIYMLCDSNLDGNGDGICQKGESCIYIFKDIDKTVTTDYIQFNAIQDKVQKK